MRPEIQAYLDGELRMEDLPAELQETAKGWEALLADIDVAPGSGLAPARIETAVMARVAGAVPGAPGTAGPLAWLLRPRELRVSPLMGGLAAAAIAVLILAPWRGGSDDRVGGADATLYVQFVLEAPSATSVAVAGDFNDWEAEHTLEDPDGDGVWTGRLPLGPGIHQYMFVIDGSEWVSPPGAEGYRDDGFGNRNGVVTVLPAV